jgi:exodeoxyribonuclease VII small subunit
MSAIQELSFEAAFAELEDIVFKLESGELSLDESVALFERGRQLSEHCQSMLDGAELRVSKLSDDGRLESIVSADNSSGGRGIPKGRSLLDWKDDED